MDYSFDNNIPIYIQIADIIRIDIISGKLKCGEKILSVREYSEVMRVNPNTMQKALASLEDEKLIYTARTSGKFVTEDKELIDKIKNKLATAMALKYFKDMNSIGISNKEAINYLKEMKG